MNNNREQATIMRRSGRTYSEIKAKLGIPLSTLSDWFRNQKWSNDIAIESIRRKNHSSAMRLMVLNTVRGGRLKKLYEDARQDALLDFEQLKFHPLFIAGIMTYWAHGDKTSKNRVLISSTDTDVIRIANLFLSKICNINDLYIQLLIHPHMPEFLCKRQWITKCGLKHEHFGKSILIRHKSRKKTVSFGVCNIGLSSAYLKNKILKWIELMSDEIGNEKYLQDIETHNI